MTRYLIITGRRRGAVITAKSARFVAARLMGQPVAEIGKPLPNSHIDSPLGYFGDRTIGYVIRDWEIPEVIDTVRCGPVAVTSGLYADMENRGFLR